MKLFVKSTILMTASALALLGCSKMGSSTLNSASTSTQSNPTNQAAAVPIIVGNGANFPGQGAMSVPTFSGVAARITNGLQGHVSVVSGNFAKAYTQVKPNLPKVSDPTAASGFDQVQLLVYAACSDLTTGSTPLMKSVYSVNPAVPIATNQGALVAAGVKMLDQYAAGLASQGPTSSTVQSTLATLVQNISSVSTNTSTVAFMSVCIAANTAGTTMLGF